MTCLSFSVFLDATIDTTLNMGGCVAACITAHVIMLPLMLCCLLCRGRYKLVCSVYPLSKVGEMDLIL